MKTWILVIVLFAASFFLRVWQVGSVPPSPDWDEASLGYNAYSILHTGKDEYGQFLPVVLRSFDDYKPALYAYLVIPFLFVFGLSVQAVRMPSILFGSVTVLVVFFLCQGLFNNKKLSFLIALLLALSPWHIQFSRIGFESNIGLSLNILGAFLFLKGLKKPMLLFGAVAAFVASLYVYQSEKVFVPLFVILLLAVFWNDIKKISKRYLVSAVILGVVLIIPMSLYLITNPNSLARARGVSVFSDTSATSLSSERIASDTQRHDYVGLLFDNRRILFGKEVIANYLSHFDLNWLFLRGDVSRHHAPFMGLIYIWELPFLLAGIYFFIFSKHSRKAKIFIVGWFLLAPLPASVTTGVPHAVRTLNFLPTFQIFTAFGLFGIFGLLSRKKMLQASLFVVIAIAAVFNFFYYFDQYFVQQNFYNSLDWQYGYQKAVSNIALQSAKKVVVSNQPPLDQSYMFFLFYLTYDPKTYQNETKDLSGGFRENHAFGKYEFRPINWNTEVKDANTIYVGRPSDFPTDIATIKTIDYLNGEPAIRIVKGNR